MYLYTVPDTHIRDLRVRAVPDESFSQGSLEIRTKTWGTGRARFTLSFRGQICVQSEEELAGENCFEWKVLRPVLWSAEDPALYDLLIEVYGRDGGLCEVIAEKA